MVHPVEPAPKAPAFTHARLSPEEADRLASMFRPSWELDDAPFTGAGTLSAADVQRLGGGGVRADVRAATTMGLGSNGSHAVPLAAPAAAAAPEASVIIDHSIATAEVPAIAAPAPVVGAKTVMGMQAPAFPPAAPAAAEAPPAPPTEPVSIARPPPSRPSQRPPAPNFVIGPPTPRAMAAAAARPARDSEPPTFPKKSRTGLFVGIGAAAVLVLGVGIWAATSGGGDKKEVAPTATAQKPTTDPLSQIPPPPATTAAATTAAAPPTPPPPPPATTAAPPVPTTPVAALPPAPPAAAPQPPPRSYSPPPAAAPAPKPPGKKPGQTIVRDVPF